MFQSVPDTAQFTAFFDGPDGVRASFSLYSRDEAASWGATELGVVAGDLETAIGDDYMVAVSNEWTFAALTSRALEAQYGLVIEHAITPVVGSVASPSLPANVAAHVKAIGTPGAPPRSGGWNFLPPCESQVVGNIIQAAPLALLQTAAESLHNAMSALSPAHVIVSRYAGTSLVEFPDGQTLKKPTKRATAVTNTVASVLVSNRVRSQRKRLPS